MMTPQEVSSHAFSKAFNGYNMAMVDEFLDLLTEDYSALYNDNAILKNKLKMLSDTVEEYRATDDAMRKTLLAAQQMADAMVKDAESKRDSLVRDAEEAARRRLEELKAEVAAEEHRLKTAQESTAAYVAKVGKLYQAQDLLLRELDKLVPDSSAAAEEGRVETAAQDIESSMDSIVKKDPPRHAEPQPEQPAGHDHRSPAPAHAAASPKNRERESVDLDHTRRFEDLQFGKDYEIR